MKDVNNQFTLLEIEHLSQLYHDCQLTLLEESELEYVLMQCNYDSPLVNQTKEFMAISRSLKLNTSKPQKNAWSRLLRVAACVAIVSGTFVIFQYINLNRDNDKCIVYVSGERVSSDIAHQIAEADVAKMQQFMQTINEQQAHEEAKVEQFMNHINQLK